MSAEGSPRIGQYEVLERLDRSGTAEVYKVRDANGRALAVKLYPAGEPEDLRQFRREALDRAMHLQHHALLRYEEVGEHDGRVFAVMELFPGTGVLGRRLALPSALRVMRQIAEGLAYLHQQGVVHGCLNPSRALLAKSADVAKISEPGMSTELRPAALDATAAMQVSRLSRYMAPEILRAGSAPNQRSDIYTLGVLFYEVLTGKLPAGRFRLPSQESAEVPPELDEVVLRCLRQEPEARFGNAHDVVAAIDAVRAKVPGAQGDAFDTLRTSAMEVLGGGANADTQRRWVLWAAIGAVAVIAALLTMLLLR